MAVKPTFLSRVGDFNSGGGAIIRGAKTVFCEGQPVGLHPSKITPHGKGPHSAAVTTTGSLRVYCEYSPVLKITSTNSCGHTIIGGSKTVVVT